MLGAGDNRAVGTQRVGGRKSLSISNTISRLKRSLGRNDSMDAEAETSTTHNDVRGIARINDGQGEIDLNELCTSDEDIQMSTNPNSIASEDSNSAELALNELGDCTNTGTTKHNKIRFSCNHCHYVAASYSGWNHHFKRLHSRLFQNGNLARQYTKVTTSPKARVPILYSCQHCNYITLSMGGFVIHSTKVHPKRKANPLKRGSPITTATNKKYLEALYLSRDESPKTKNKVHKLLAAHHRDSRVLEEIPRYLSTKCILCNQNFATTGMLGQHYEGHHSGQGPKRNLNTGLYCCKLCSFEALTRMALHKHYVKNHFIDAFFAWSVPSLEPMLQEKHREWNGNVYPFEETVPGLERLDTSLPETMMWNEEDAADQHIARETIPCISCEFATRNVIELLSHYQIAHDGLYPSGFGIFLLECLIKHSEPIYIPSMEVDVIDKLHGAWADDNGQILQYYTYQCLACDFTSNRFDLILSHFTKVHPAMNCSALNVLRKVARSLPAETNITEFSQCYVCGFIVMDAMELEMQEHCEAKHGVACRDKYAIYNLLERRNCQHCDFVGNIDSMQWHYAESHDCCIFLWHNLKVYVSDFNAQEFSCCVCEFSTKCDWDLSFHYKEKHFQRAITFETVQTDGQSKYRCVLCSTMTNSLPKMIAHHQHCTFSLLLSQASPESQKRYLSCKHCKKVFTTSSTLWVHITQHHCSFSQLFSVDDLPEHTLKYGYWTSKLIPIENHASAQAESITKHSARPVRCSRSIQHSNDYQLVARETSSNKDKNSTSKIRGSLSGESRIVAHTFKCKFCPLSTTLRSSLTEHLTSLHKYNITFRCLGCEKQFSSISDCILHHLHIHGLDISQETAYNFLLNDISIVKHESAGFTCTLCDFRGLSRIVVLNHFCTSHIRPHHAGRKNWKKNGPYSCRWCKYYTKNATSMRAHLSSRHERTVSYHSLTNFRSLETDTAKSSDSSDEDYVPSKRKHQNSTKPRKMRCHRLSLQCTISEDRDSFRLEDLRCTHVRHKHNTEHPYTCRFCMKAFVCATTFLKHCAEEHTQWCSLSFTLQHIIMVPDTSEIEHMRKHKEQEHDSMNTKDDDISVIRNSDWPCELCGSKHYSLKDLQQHACTRHSNRKLLLCRHCDFTSLTEKKIVAHSQQHIRRNSRNEELSSRFRQRVDDDANFVNDDDVIDLVTMESNSTESCQQTIIEHQAMDIDEPQTSSCLQAFDNDSGHSQFSMSAAKARKSIRGRVGNDFLSSKTPTSNIQCDIHGKVLAACEDHVTIESGLISCSKCKFSCTDVHRITAHIKSTHTKVKSFSCKFCDFSSDNFSSLDRHLAKFHKIVKNHQLGLQVQSASTDEITTDTLESRSRYLYTPTPCLPILREEVIYIDDETEDSTITPGSPVRRQEEQNFDELKCSYCGFSADSTFILEMHMRRHEG